MSEIKRHAQEIFTATLEAFPRAGRAESLTGVGDSFAAPDSVV